MTQSDSEYKPTFVPELWAREIMAEYNKAKAMEDAEKMAKKTWVPVCAFCKAWDERNGRTLLEYWHRYDSYGDGDHEGGFRFGPAPTPGSCALQVAGACKGNDWLTPIGEGVLKQQPAKKKAASKKPPSIYPPWPKVGVK